MLFKILKTFQDFWQENADTITNSDSSELFLIMHTLKSNSATIGATALAAEAARLEVAIGKNEDISLTKLQAMLRQTLDALTLVDLVNIPTNLDSLKPR